MNLHARMIVGVCLLLTLGCGTNSEWLSGNETRVNEDKVESNNTMNINAQIHLPQPPKLFDRKCRVPGNNLLGFYFVDENHGWVVSRHIVFRTINGGGEWKASSIYIGSGSSITAVRFVDPQRGWLFVQEGSTLSFDQSSALVVYESLDGGSTWKQSARFQGVYYSGVALTSSDVWVSGSRYLGDTPQRFQSFVGSFSIHEPDNWKDQSVHFEGETEDDYPALTLSRLAGIETSENGCVAVLSESEQVSHTCNNGSTWTNVMLNTKLGVLEGYGVKSFEIADEFVRVLKATQGSDRPAGSFVLTQGIRGRDVASMVSLSGYYARTLCSVSERNFFVSVASSLNHGRSLLLHSTDGGQSFSNIHDTMGEIVGLQYLHYSHQLIILISTGELIYLDVNG